MRSDKHRSSHPELNDRQRSMLFERNMRRNPLPVLRLLQRLHPQSMTDILQRRKHTVRQAAAGSRHTWTIRRLRKPV